MRALLIIRFDVFFNQFPELFLGKILVAIEFLSFEVTIETLHVYEEDLEKYKDDIIWLPEEPAELRKN